jgi:hypothetical protein
MSDLEPTVPPADPVALTARKRINVLLLVEVQASSGHELDYQYVVERLQAALEKGEFRAGNPRYAWWVRSAKEAVAP